MVRFAGAGVDYAGEDIGDGGSARDAALVYPGSVTVRPDGVYIADTFNHRVRRVGTDGVITTVAGSGPNGTCCLATYGGDGGPALEAKLNQPNQVRFDGAGNLYILDAGNYRIRRVTADGIIRTVAGNGQRGFSGDGGPALEASFDIGPNGDTGSMEVLSDGTIYLMDIDNRRLRRIDGVTGIVTTVAGGGSSLDDEVPATEAFLNARGFAVADDGSILLSDYTRIRRVGIDGRIRTEFGAREAGFVEDGATSVTGRLTGLDRLHLRPTGEIVFVEGGSQRLREIDRSGRLRTLAGIGPRSLGENGHAVGAALPSVGSQLAISPAGEVVLGGATRVRAIRHDGVLETILGGGFPPAGRPPSPRPALGIPFDAQGLAWDRNGSLFATAYRDLGRLDPDGTFTTLCCDDYGFAGDGGPLAEARFDNTIHLAFDSAGNLFIADAFNHRVRRVDASTGIVSTVAGKAPPHPPNVIVSNPSSGDGGLATDAELSAPNFIAVDGQDRLYIADAPGIRRVDADGRIRSVLPGCSGPMAPDGGGAILVACNSEVRRISSSGGVKTLVRFGGNGFGGDGGPAEEALIGFIAGIVSDEEGNLYLFDATNRRIRAVRAAVP